MKKSLLVITFCFMSICFSGCETIDDGYSCDSKSPNRVGAMCNDGTRSNSVGSGTCSSHGGVDYWICK
jgi:hypothetical protein